MRPVGNRPKPPTPGGRWKPEAAGPSKGPGKKGVKNMKKLFRKIGCIGIAYGMPKGEKVGSIYIDYADKEVDVYQITNNIVNDPDLGELGDIHYEAVCSAVSGDSVFITRYIFQVPPTKYKITQAVVLDDLR